MPDHDIEGVTVRIQTKIEMVDDSTIVCMPGLVLVV